ncbi:hypothetical protein EC991_005789 [Linnemannia zychae]|nr:hypothetical protein EC991_005789 [Linnemannia zychae]
MDLDMNSNSDVDVVTVDEVVPRKKSRGHVAAAAAATSNPTESLVPATVSKNKSSKRGAAIAASITSTDTKTTSPATTNTAPVTKATALVAEASPVNEEGDKITNIENDSNATDKDHPAPTSSAKKSKRISTTTGKGTTAKSRRSKSAVAAPSSTEAVSPAAPTSSTPLTGAASSAPSTAAPTPGPGSDAAPQKRVLPSRGGGLRDKNTISIEPSLLEPPPVPAGDQFLQEEKKRKMQLLTKALAKAEAEAAAEAKALAQSEAAPSTTPRAVSTRQKHKAIVNNQQVSVQTAVPSFFSSSSTHVKRATTTNTTVGKIEGTMSGGGGAGGSYATQEENLSDEVYEKRHRKQEMVEKKLKNREKEKLRHAMYQQQLVVEKLRHMEVNRLVPISAFRSLQKTIELEQQLKEANASLDDAHQHHSNSISLAAAKMMQDEYHRRLLQEAEENLRRYEQLGLADSANISSAPAYTPFSRTKNRLVTIMTDLDEEEQAPVSEHVAASSDKRDRPSRRSHPNGLAPSETRRKRPKSADSLMGDAQESASPQRRRKKISAASSGDATSISPKAQATPAAPAKLSPTPVVEPPRPPKPITTFIKPGSILASGSRKSYRVTLAFGEKVPSLDRIDFDLPLDLFGDLIRERFGDNEAALQPLKGVAGFKASKKQHQQLASRSVSTETGVPASFSSTGDDTSESQAEVTEPSSAVSSSSSPASSPVSVSSTT